MGDLDLNQKNIDDQQDNDILSALREVLVISEGKSNSNYDSVHCDIYYKFRDVYANEKICFIFHNIDMRITDNNLPRKDILVSKAQYLLEEYRIASSKRIFVKQLVDEFLSGKVEGIIEILESIQLRIGPVKLKSGKVDFISKRKYNSGQVRKIITSLERLRCSGKLDELERYLLQRLQDYGMPSKKLDNLKERIEKVYQKEYSREG